MLRVSVPEQVLRSVPNPLPVAETGKLYASYATFVYPDNCPEPEKICTVTGQPRRGLLYQVFRELDGAGFVSLGIRSLQLAPGVGEYSPDALWTVLEEVFRTGAAKTTC